jgi:shikimate dehydrogenase
MTPPTATSFLIGLIGAGIQASRAPRMHEAEAEAQGLKMIYKLIDLTVLGLTVEALPDLLTAAERMGFAALNITHPCKQAVLPLLHDLSADARALGAVNTVILRDGRRVGHNTDWYGFSEAFSRDLADAPRDLVLQFGAGGAGVAVGHAALMRGVKRLVITDVIPARAATLAAALCERFGAGRAEAVTDAADVAARADGIVNATPVGMDDHPGMAFPATWLRPSLWVAEVIYFPLETELLRRARALGCRTLYGGGMAVGQAVEAFRLFTGRAADPDRVTATFHSFDKP